MVKFIKNIKKTSIKVHVYHGWDFNFKKWFIKIRGPLILNSNVTEWFDKKESYQKFLRKIH